MYVDMQSRIVVISLSKGMSEAECSLIRQCVTVFFAKTKSENPKLQNVDGVFSSKFLFRLLCVYTFHAHLRLSKVSG